MNPVCSLFVIAASMTAASVLAESPVVLAIHGGAGVSRSELSAEQEAACRETLAEALRKGSKVIEGGGTSLDAVGEAIGVLEDSPLFNAGRGSVLTAGGAVEMDASIMDGATVKAGAVAGVRGVRNPIQLARAVMDKSPHVMLTGKGAEEFAREQNLRFEPAEYFIVPERVKQLEKAKKKAAGHAGAAAGDHAARIGTVGAVALDRHGHLAAGTSTGGMVNKRLGRVGDSPVIGAGTYAEDGVVAVSCTGHGEFFIRAVVAHDVAARMKYQQATVAAATREIVHTRLKNLGGEGGLIALDAKGNVSTPFNTPGMYHGTIRADGTVRIAIFEE
ncbi:MAG: isoaspartyl peptidase/L-asparaginase [Chthoniobacteraceae bacterium]